MPRIKRVIATERPAVLQLPRNIPVQTAEDLGAGAFQELGAFGGELAKIGLKLQAQEDELAVTELRGKRDLAINELALKIASEEEDPKKHAQLFLVGGEEIQQSILGMTNRTPVKQTLQKHFNLQFPKDLIAVRANALKKFNDQQLETFDRVEDQLAKKAAVSPPEVQLDVFLLHGDLLDSAVARGFMKPTERGDRERAFQENVLLKRMEFLRVHDRDRLFKEVRSGAFFDLDPLKLAKGLEAARKDADREDKRREDAFDEAKEVALTDATVKAMQGDLTDTFLSETMRGLNPHISPTEGANLQRLNDSPPLAPASRNVLSLRQEYHLGSRTVERIKKFRGQLKDLALQSGRPTKLISEFGDELQTDEATARRDINTGLALEIKLAEDLYKSRAERSIFGGVFGKISDNQRQQDLSRIRLKVRDGIPHPQAVKDVMEERAAESAATISPEDQGVIDLTR